MTIERPEFVNAVVCIVPRRPCEPQYGAVISVLCMHGTLPAETAITAIAEAHGGKVEGLEPRSRGSNAVLITGCDYAAVWRDVQAARGRTDVDLPAGFAPLPAPSPAASKVHMGPRAERARFERAMAATTAHEVAPDGRPYYRGDGRE